MLGYAFQKGLVPLGLDSIERAVELNGVAVDINKRAIAWGRLAAHDIAQVAALVQLPLPIWGEGRGEGDTNANPLKTETPHPTPLPMGEGAGRAWRAAAVPISPEHALAAVVERRAAFLADYHDAAYAQRYRDVIARIEAAENARAR